MADLATLGLAVDSSPVVRATADLDRLSTSAGSAERAAVGVGQGFDATAAAMQRAAAGSSQVAAGLARATQAANENARAVGLSRHEYLNLSYQLSDIVSQASAGASAFTIFVQQGGQIAPVLAQAGGRLGGVFGQIVEGASAAAARVGLVGGALGVVTGGIVAAVAAQQSYAGTQRQVDQALAGVGRSSGATTASVNAAAQAYASAGSVSVREARSMAAEFAATGRVGGEMFQGLIQTTRDFAATTGQDLPDAAKDLAVAFADPAKGADLLNAKIGFLNDATRENVQRLQAQGDRLGAQQALFAAYSQSLVTAGEMTSAWGRVTHTVGTVISDIWDGIGQRIDRVVTGGPLEQQMADARQWLSNTQAQTNSPLGRLFSSRNQSEIAQAQAEVDRVQGLMDARARRSQQAQTAQNSLLLGNLMRQLEPENERFKQIQDRVELLRKAVSDPLRFGLDASSLAPVESAFERLMNQLRAMREDMERFGTAADAAAVRASNFNLRTATYDPFGRSVAQSNETYTRALRDRGLDPNITADQVRSRYGEQMQNDTLGPSELRALASARDAALRDVASRDALATIRDNEIQTARIQAVTSSTSRSGLLNTVPERYRQMFVNAAAQTGLPLDVGIALARQENAGFNPTIVNRGQRGESHATGLMQLQPGTARQMGVTDITDPQQNLIGGFRYARQQLDAANGDVAEMYRRYHDGPGATGPASVYAARGAANIQRMLNMPTSSAQVLEGDNRERDLQAQQRQAQITADLYGRNGMLFDAQTRREQMLQDARNRGIVIDENYIASVDKVANGLAQNARNLANTRLGADLSFERDQLGRTASEQAAFSRARGQFGDTTSPEAQMAISQSLDLSNLKEARSTFQDTASGLVSSLTRGGSAAQAFSNALNRLGDKLLSIGFDQIGASLFGGSKGGSGGIGGLFSSLFGGGGGSAAAVAGPQLIDGTLWFADGGVMTSQGAMPLHRYATGGIASSPQVAIFGEGRGPEAYVPLPDGRRIPVAMQGAAANGNATGYTDARTISIDARGSNLTEAQIRGVVVQAIAANNQEQYRNQAVEAETYRRLAG